MDAYDIEAYTMAMHQIEARERLTFMTSLDYPTLKKEGRQKLWKETFKEAGYKKKVVSMDQIDSIMGGKF